MLIRKDYAKYFETKNQWKKHLSELDKKITRGMFWFALVICIAQLWIK